MARKVKKAPVAKRRTIVAKKMAKKNYLSSGQTRADGIIGYWALVFAILFVSANMIMARVSAAIAEDVEHTQVNEVASASIETVKNQAIQKPEESGKCNFGATGTMPYMISMPSIGINDACVEKMPSGDYLEDPKDAWNFGWYSGSMHPTIDGLGVYDCHTGFGVGALCNDLAKLQTGNEIIITTGSGQKATFYVRRVEMGINAEQPSNYLNKLFTPYIPEMGAVNFLTCSGSFVNGHATERTIIYATM